DEWRTRGRERRSRTARHGLQTTHAVGHVDRRAHAACRVGDTRRPDGVADPIHGTGSSGCARKTLFSVHRGERGPELGERLDFVRRFRPIRVDPVTGPCHAYGREPRLEGTAYVARRRGHMDMTTDRKGVVEGKGAGQG